MVLVYRVLGVAAAVNNTLARHRVNFVPSNFIIGAVAACIFFFNATGWLEAVDNGAIARPVQLGELSPGAIGRATFIRTTGVLVPGAGFQYGEQDKEGNITKLKMEFVPIVDRDSARGLFVQLPASHRFGSEPRETEINGMVRPMQEFLSRELRQSNFEYGGVQMLPDYVLVADETPGDPASWQMGAALSGGVVLIFGLMLVKRNTIFVPGGAAADASGAGADLTTLGATGIFLLEKHKQRFMNVPAAIGTLDNGDLALLANVDASSAFMGVTYAQRAGIWVMPMAPGSIGSLQEGTLYYGTKAIPAVRFSYKEAGSNTSRIAVVTTSSATACRLLMDQLSSGGVPQPTAPAESPRAAAAPPNPAGPWHGLSPR
jgi:hypothetical protein